jgi:hypothetical protein
MPVTTIKKPYRYGSRKYQEDRVIQDSKKAVARIKSWGVGEAEEKPLIGITMRDAKERLYRIDRKFTNKKIRGK